MGFDRGRRGERGGRGRDKRDGFGEGEFQSAPSEQFGGGFGGNDRFGGGGSRPGGGGGRPSMPAQVVGQGSGTVKFFNGQKGFGFVTRDDGGEDVFVHISAVEALGLTGLADGQPLNFTLVDRNGRISATDLAIEGEPMPIDDRGSRPPREGGFGAGRPDRGPRMDRGAGGGGGGGGRSLTGESATGTVKFFNAMKGFGFISRDDGQPDAFVHISAVERAGFKTINEGEKYKFDIEVDGRGKHAAVNLSSAD